MKKKTSLTLLTICSITFLFSFSISHFKPVIPKVWDVEKIKTLHLPYPDSSIKITPPSEEYYYQLKERVSFKTYPFYMPGREPEGYYESLAKLDPVINFNEAELKTEADWIKAGELIYDLPQNFFPIDSAMLAALPGLGKTWKQNGVQTNNDGIIPYIQIVVRQKGKPELGLLACGTCHSKLMPDGELLKGAQGNFALDKFSWALNKAEFENKKMSDEARLEFVTNFITRLYYAPWVKHKSQEYWKTMSFDERLAVLTDRVPGVMNRHNASLSYPISVPDFYNMKERKYLDKTGHIRQRDIGDLMRYATLNQNMDILLKYGDFTPLPNPANPKDYIVGRFSDPQLYALAKFIYALETPKNPEKFDAASLAKGKKIFIEQGCVTCHTPPLYTNNKLTPADGFEPTASHFKEYGIFNVSVETDPGLALYTRRSTGFYKIPSLIGAWNRTGFLHNGHLATLEDLFDGARFSPDYIPTAYKPYGVEKMAVVGHPFGMELKADEKKALVAFIKSL